MYENKEPCYFFFKRPLRRSSVHYCVSLKTGTYILIFIQKILRSYSQGIFLLHITIYIYLDTTIYIYSHSHEEEYVFINTFMFENLHTFKYNHVIHCNIVISALVQFSYDFISCKTISLNLSYPTLLLSLNELFLRKKFARNELATELSIILCHELIAYVWSACRLKAKLRRDFYQL